MTVKRNCIMQIAMVRKMGWKSKCQTKQTFKQNLTRSIEAYFIITKLRSGRSMIKTRCQKMIVSF